MVISKNSQLGLMIWDIKTMQEYLIDAKSSIEKEKERIKKNINILEDGLPITDEVESVQIWAELRNKLGYNKDNKGAEFYTIPHPNPYYYLIMQSVDTCADMIKIKENFSCSIFNKIRDGEHVYLLGQNEFFRFVKFNGGIRGSYWDRSKKIAFEVGFLLDQDRYYFATEYTKEFNRIVRLMTFIELGDIEVVYLEKGRNNGKTKKEGKITNTSQYNVYVVDSSWNKLIIRTEGFAVRGHFRLQPCGHNMADRKLIWINAFEKEGYKRRPKAQIIS